MIIILYYGNNSRLARPSVPAALTPYTRVKNGSKKSINCQAEAVAIYVSLCRQNVLKEALASEEAFLKTVYKNKVTKQIIYKFNHKLLSHKI